MNEMYEEFHYFATWLPDLPLQIGDIGELKHNEFTYVSSLNKKGMDFNVRRDSSKGELKHRSGGGVSVSTKLRGDAGIPQFNLDVADAGIVVTFGSNAGVVFEATGTEHQLIADVDALDRTILDAHEHGEWKDDWVVISDLMMATSATILISQGRDAAIGLKAKMQVPRLSLANLDAGFEITNEKNMNVAIICQSGLTPLFKVRGINKTFWGWGKPESGGIQRMGQEFESGILRAPKQQAPLSRDRYSSGWGLSKSTGQHEPQVLRPVVSEIAFEPFQ
jgi:hypothetical protein